MKTFTIGQLEIDIIRHVRVDGSRFPTPDPGAIADYFIIAARWQGRAIDFYPSTSKKAEPLSFGFVGRKVVNVYDDEGKIVGTKRGGDFRSRFFPLLARRLGKAILARQLGKTVRETTSADEAEAGAVMRRLLRADFTTPADMRLMTIDGAARFLRDADGDLDEGEKPPGTVVNIDCDYDAQATVTGGQTENGSTPYSLGFLSGTQIRGVFRFPLTSIAAGAAVNDSVFQFNSTGQNSVEAGDEFNFNQYGTSDPDTDTGATKYANAGGPTYATLTGLDTTGSKSVDLGTTADTDIGSQLASPGWFTVGIAGGTGVTAPENIRPETLANVGTDPATLTVDYTSTDVDITIVSVTSTASSISNVPAINYDWVFSSSVASSSAAGQVPVVGIAALISAVAATGGLSGLSPSLLYDYGISSQAAAASTAALASSLLYDYVIESTAALATSEGLGAVIGLGTTVLAEVASAVLAGNAPRAALDWVVSSALAEALSEVLESEVALSIEIQAAVAEITAALLSGEITADRSIVIRFSAPAIAELLNWKMLINVANIEDLVTASYLLSNPPERASRHVGRGGRRLRQRY